MVALPAGSSEQVIIAISDCDFILTDQSIFLVPPGFYRTPCLLRALNRY